MVDEKSLQIMNVQYPKKLSLVAGAMLLLAIPPMWPYGYYQLLRWVVCGVAAYNAYGAHCGKRKGWVFTMIGIAVLFNPIAPIFLDKATWVVLDVVTALIMLIFSKKVGFNPLVSR